MSIHRIDVERARREAKALLDRARAGDPHALARLRPDRSPRLADAQHAVALSFGHRDWAELVRLCEDSGAALRRAARTGDEDRVYELLEAGAPVNEPDPRTGRTPLLEAVAADQLDSVAALIGWVPVDRQARDRRGYAAMDLARPGSPVAQVLAACGLGKGRPTLGDEHATLTDEAELALLDHLAHAPGVDRQAIGDGYLMRTGLLDNSRNVIVSSRLPVFLSVDDIIGRLVGVPARWHTGDISDSLGLRLVLERAGCRPDQSSVHMAAALRDMATTPSDAVREVHAANDFAHVDVGEARLLASAGAPLRHFVIGRSAGLTTFTAGCTVLGVRLWVERSSRRSGISRTLVRHAAAVARAEGCTHAVLAPTPATISFYERMGFVLERSTPDRWYFLP